MALEKIRNHPTGFQARYHRVDSVFYNRRGNFTEVVVGVYRTQTHSDEGAAPLETLVLKIEGEENAAALAQIHPVAAPIIYAALKSTPEFEGAEDV